MIAINFRTPGNGAGGGANEGRRELAQSTPASAYASSRLTYRAHHTPDGERADLAQLHEALGAHFPRSRSGNRLGPSVIRASCRSIAAKSFRSPRMLAIFNTE